MNAAPAPAASPAVACPVCACPDCTPWVRCGGVDYFDCPRCRAIHLPAAHWLDEQAEADYYRLHRNGIQDPGYRKFLSTLADPLLARLPPASCGLDFGCGPGPALADMLRQAGHAMAVHDPLFFPDPAVLERRYDFITCSEVVEHLRQPAAVFERLFGLLHPGGILAVMTRFPPAAEAFERWHYRRDPTHIVFYPPATFRFLAKGLGAHCEIPCDHVALLHRAA